MKTYDIYFTEQDGVERHTTFTGPQSRSYIVDFFGLNGPDVVSYRIVERK
jgi:hypothetical protein